ncbi:MAG TPA: hypothetical protein EYG51_24375 [Pseudomonadales bacterium]|nr:hypothetical protein [Pseudomonadales bacterium]
MATLEQLEQAHAKCMAFLDFEQSRPFITDEYLLPYQKFELIDAFEYCIESFKSIPNIAATHISNALRYIRSWVKMTSRPPISRKRKSSMMTLTTQCFYFNRGCCNHNLGDYDYAIADYTKSLQLTPFYEAYQNRGRY